MKRQQNQKVIKFTKYIIMAAVKTLITIMIVIVIIIITIIIEFFECLLFA